MHTIFEIFFIDNRTRWAIAEYTFEGHDQVGEARFFYHKADALAEARQWDAHKPVRIFDCNGRIQKTLIGHA